MVRLGNVKQDYILLQVKLNYNNESVLWRYGTFLPELLSKNILHVEKILPLINNWSNQSNCKFCCCK